MNGFIVRKSCSLVILLFYAAFYIYFVKKWLKKTLVNNKRITQKLYFNQIKNIP